MEENSQKSSGRKSLIQLIKFALVGASSTLISWLIYLVIIYFGGHYTIATITEFVISVFYSYLLNNHFVFTKSEDEKRVWWKVLLKTYASYSVGYILNIFLLFIWVDVVNLPRYMEPLAIIAASFGQSRMDAQFWGEAIAAAINLLVTVPVNFLLNKYWAFRKSVNT